MTTTTTTDPLGPVRLEQRLGDIRGYDHRTHGIYHHGRNYCGVYDDAGRYYCTRVQNHDEEWPHIATNGTRIVSIWGGGPPPPPTVQNNGVDITLGTPLADIPDAHDPGVGVYVDPVIWCAHPINDRYVCTRPQDHTPGVHIGCTPTQVVALLETGGKDRFQGVSGNYYTDYADPSNEVDGLYVGEDRQCKHRKQGSDYGCTRPVNHPGDHKCFRANGQFRWTTARLDRPFAIVGDVELQEPADGTLADPDTLVIESMPPVGTLVRLRHRKNRMYVMEQRGDNVGVLDLQWWRVREVPLTALVPTGQETISEADLRGVIRWYGGHRDQIKRVAVREYKGGRWCMNGLNENLRALGLEEHQPTLTGTVKITFPFDCPDPSAGQSTIEKALITTLRDPKVIAALKAVIPPVDGVDLDVANLTANAVDFTRK